MDAEGYIVTNAHVVGLTRQVQVLVPLAAENRTVSRSVIKPTGKLVTARVVGIDNETDIAILKIEEKGLPSLRCGDSEALRQGQIVLAFGSPFGLENSVTMGVVSSAARQIRPDHPPYGGTPRWTRGQLMEDAPPSIRATIIYNLAVALLAVRSV